MDVNAMQKRWLTVLIAFALVSGQAGSSRLRAGQAPPDRATSAAPRVHDPCIIRQGSDYYVFSTGRGIPICHSRDLIHWESAGRAFAEDVPAWAKAELPRATGLWAPDIAFFNGKYHLYYSVSTFGSNRSLIGLATNTTLDPQSKAYHWQDEGKVFESFPADNYNAIDSNALVMGNGRLVLCFGSFWSGVKLIEADLKTGKPRPGARVQPLAQRPPPDALEAPFLIARDGWYYLFVSFDRCCRGVDSTYNIRVGRARQVEGPYTDREGRPMREGGATPLLASQGLQIGPGHCAVMQDGKRWLLAYHFYDKASNGFPTLQVRSLAWDRDGWPNVEPLPNTPSDEGGG